MPRWLHIRCRCERVKAVGTGHPSEVMALKRKQTVWMLTRTERVRNTLPIAVSWNIPRSGGCAARRCKHHEVRLQAPERAEQPSPGKLFREATGQLPAPKLRKRARATRPSQAAAEASTVAERVFLGSPTGPTPASKRRERAFGQPDRPDPSPNLR